MSFFRIKLQDKRKEKNKIQIEWFRWGCQQTIIFFWTWFMKSELWQIYHYWRYRCNRSEFLEEQKTWQIERVTAEKNNPRLKRNETVVRMLNQTYHHVGIFGIFVRANISWNCNNIECLLKNFTKNENVKQALIELGPSGRKCLADVIFTAIFIKVDLQPIKGSYWLAK